MSTEAHDTERNRDLAQDQNQDQLRDQDQSPHKHPSRPSEDSTPKGLPEKDHAQSPVSDAASERSVPRTSPIVWGTLILTFCAFVAQRSLNPGQLDAVTWITATVIGLGLLLLGVGAAVIVRNRRR